MTSLDSRAATAVSADAPRVVNPILKDVSLARAPVTCQKLTASPRGLVFHRAVPLDVPFGAIRLIAACHDHHAPKDAPVLLLFVQGQPRPFLVSALHIAFREFSGVLGETLAVSFRNFLAHLVHSCPGILVDQGTWAVLHGDAAFAPRPLDVLATSLARVLNEADAVASGDSRQGDSRPRDGTDMAPDQASTVPLVWNAGDVILGFYEVTKVHQSGGMGLVYRVRHRGWQTDLAVKAPRPEFFRTETDVATFERECETWINLGLYPHIVSCYYVRRLGGVPRVFAEYVDGGSLQDWISSRRLYADDPHAALLRALDLAIQFAWGLHFAHDQGLIHQDVKPGNVLVTTAGIAKVTDFGLAHARSSVERPGADSPADVSLVATFGGMTPAYCSPEQAAMLAARRAGTPRDALPPLTRRTDIWSWAVSVLEMFTGGVTWMGGQAAAAALEHYLENGPDDSSLPPMPEAVAELLGRCFSLDPTGRPATLLDVVEPLRTAYAHVAGQPYPRRRPEPATMLADGLNNRAVSLLDIGRAADAERLFDEALAADGGHVEASFNRALMRWRGGLATDQAVVAEVAEVAKGANDPRAAADLVGLLHIERHDAESALAAIDSVAGSAPGSSDQSIRQRAESLRPHAARALRVIEPLAAALRAVAVSADGRVVLGGGLDNMVHVWDAVSGSVLRSFFGHQAWVTCLALTADGRLALSGSVDDTVRVWNVATGQCLSTLEGHTDDVSSVAVQAAGRWGVSGAYDHTVRVWEFPTGQCLRLLEGHTNWVSAVALGRDSRTVVSASYDGTLRVWDAPTGGCLHVLQGHQGRVTTVAASADARWAISGGADRSLRLWDVPNGKCVRVLQGHAGEITSVDLSADGRFALSGSADHTVRLWDTSSGRCLRTFQGHVREITAVAVSTDASLAVTASVDCSLRLWNTRGLCHHPLPAPPALSRVTSAEASLEAEARFLALLGNGREALSADRADEALAVARAVRSLPGRNRDGEALGLWTDLSCRCQRVGLSAAWCVRVMSGHTTEVKGLAVTPDGRMVASTGPEGTVRVRELATGRAIRTLEGHTHGVSAIAACPDGHHLASVGGDGRLCLWDLDSGACERVVDGFEPNGQGLAISDDQRWLLRANGPRIGLWEFSTGRQVRSFPAPSGMLMDSVILLPDGELAAASTLDYKTQVFELAGGRKIGSMDNCGPLTASPDGRLLAAVGLDAGVQKVVIWALHSRTQQFLLGGHVGPITATAFAPDSRWLFTASRDGTVRVWDLSTGAAARVLEGFVHPVVALAMAPDGGHLVMGCTDGSVQVWALDWELAVRPRSNWDDAAQPHLEAFLRRHRAPAAELPQGRAPFDEEIALALTRRGAPDWTTGDVDDLMRRLGQSGHGHVRREGVLAKLVALAAGMDAAVPASGSAHPDAARALRKGADRLESDVLPLLATLPTDGGDMYQAGQMIAGLWRALADTLETGMGAGGLPPSVPEIAVTVFGNTSQIGSVLRATGNCPPHVLEHIASVRRLAIELMPAASLPETTVFYSRKIRDAADQLEAAFLSPGQPLPTAPIDMEKVLRQLVGAFREFTECLAGGVDQQGQPASRLTLAHLLAEIVRNSRTDHFRQVIGASFGARLVNIWGTLGNLAELAELMEAQVSATAIAPAVPAAVPQPTPPGQPSAAPAPPAPAAVGIECPKCGATGQQGAECRSCGLLFARYRPGPILKRAADRLRAASRQIARMPPVVNEFATFWDTLPDAIETGVMADGARATPYLVGLLLRDNVDMMEDRLVETLGECPAQLRTLMPEVRRLSRHMMGDPLAPAARAALAETLSGAAAALEAIFKQPERPFPLNDQGMDSGVFLNFFVILLKGFPGQLTGNTEAEVIRGTAEAVQNSCGTMLSNNVLGIVMHSCPSQFVTVFKAVNLTRTAARIISGQ
ncbi:MAG TPA: protein kinase [Vicinamibacterales bacterium]|jgi:WD40 repeat protein/serine/threonine protein kinase